jgi:Fe-S-cluster containining protein
MKNGKPFPIPVRAKPRVKYSCVECPAYCCSYPEIEVTSRDVERLAKHFGLSYQAAEERFTKHDGKVRMLRHRQDRIFTSVCTFLDQKKRRCTIYEARPGVCREYPDTPRCGYYEFLKFERAQQDDPKFIALT